MTRFKIVIIQLARLGDLAQAWPLISRCLAGAGQGRVGLVVDERVSALAELMVGKGNILSVPVEAIQRTILDNSNGFANRILQLNCELVEFSTEYALNLNFHNASAALLEALPTATARLGARLKDIKAEVPSDAVLFELFTSSQGLRQNGRHISDIWLDYAQDSQDRRELIFLTIPAEAQDKIDALFNRLGWRTSTNPVVILPGSGQSGRIWPERYFAEVVRNLKSDTPVVFAGSKFESDTVERINKSAGSVIPGANFCSETTLPELAALLQRARLVVGVDTGPLHLAAMAGAKCLGLYFGSMFYRQTGPYGDGHLVLIPQRRDYPCCEAEMARHPTQFEADLLPEDLMQTMNLRVFQNKAPNLKSARLLCSSLHKNGLDWT